MSNETTTGNPWPDYRRLQSVALYDARTLVIETTTTKHLLHGELGDGWLDIVDCKKSLAVYAKIEGEKLLSIRMVKEGTNPREWAEVTYCGSYSIAWTEEKR